MSITFISERLVLLFNGKRKTNVFQILLEDRPAELRLHVRNQEEEEKEEEETVASLVRRSSSTSLRKSCFLLIELVLNNPPVFPP